MILLFSWVMDVKAGRFFDGSWSSSGGDDDDDECDDASSSLSLSRHPVATVGGVGGVGGMTAYLFVRSLQILLVCYTRSALCGVDFASFGVRIVVEGEI